MSFKPAARACFESIGERDTIRKIALNFIRFQGETDA
jgi:hypothetical protein